MGAIIFTGNDILNNFDRIKSAIYITLHRPFWTIGLCWIVFASLKGYAGFIGCFLSLPVFQLLGKLTYSMYLLHLVIIVLNSASIRTPQYISDYQMVRYILILIFNLLIYVYFQIYIFCGDFLFTMFFSVIWVLLFESPVVAIEKIFLNKGKYRHASKFLFV